jgi:hypothetical protein
MMVVKHNSARMGRNNPCKETIFFKANDLLFGNAFDLIIYGYHPIGIGCVHAFQPIG